jgi:hypothetical protein
MQYRQAFRLVATKFRQEGITGIASRVLSRPKPHPEGIKFDRRFGTDTEIVVPLWKLNIESANLGDGTRYQSADPNFVRSAIAGLPIKFDDFVYIDLGSGKGRTLLVASDFPFKQVRGVEFSLDLHRTAQDNIRVFPKGECADVSSVHEDAALYQFPDENLVIYLYHPFGESVLRPVIENLRRVRREIYVIYFNPVLEQILAESGFLRRVSGLDKPIKSVVYRSY